MREELSNLSGAELQIADPVKFLSTVDFTELPIIEPNTVTGATPSALNCTTLVLANTAPTNITNFQFGREGQVINVVGDGQSTFINSSLIALNGGADKLAESNVVYPFLFYAGSWIEVGGAGSGSLPPLYIRFRFDLTLSGSNVLPGQLTYAVVDLRKYSNVRMSVNYSVSSVYYTYPSVRLGYSSSFYGPFGTLVSVDINMMTTGEFLSTSNIIPLLSDAKIQNCFLRMYVASNNVSLTVPFNITAEFT